MWTLWRAGHGYSDRGVNDVEGPEAAVGAGAAGGAQNSGGLGMGIGPNGITPSLPVILDLDGDGVEVSFGTQAAFDLDGDGFREQTAWAAPEDGFLVIDLNADGSRGIGDGKIDQAGELAFAQWAEGEATDLASAGGSRFSQAVFFEEKFRHAAERAFLNMKRLIDVVIELSCRLLARKEKSLLTAIPCACSYSPPRMFLPG